MKRLVIVIAALALAAAACGGSDDGGSSDATAAPPGAGIAAEGERIFGETCSTCHGPDAMGIEGLGKALVDNEFVQTHSDDELVDFLRIGRLASDPLNTTGVDMPPKGGNPSLDDTDLLDVVAYVRTLQP